MKIISKEMALEALDAKGIVPEKACMANRKEGQGWGSG